MALEVVAVLERICSSRRLAGCEKLGEVKERLGVMPDSLLLSVLLGVVESALDDARRRGLSEEAEALSEARRELEWMLREVAD